MNGFFKWIRKRMKPKRLWLTYISFLLIASIMWLLNTLNKQQTLDLDFDTSFIDLPAHKALVEAPDKQITLTVSAKGFSLLKYKLQYMFNALSISAHQTLKRNPAVRGGYYILSSSVLRSVQARLGDEVELVRIHPDTIHFVFDDSISRKIPVKVLARFRFDDMYRPVDKVKVRPRLVTVSGRRSVVDTMQHVYTDGCTFNGLNEDLDVALDLEPIEGVVFSPDKVDISLQVIQYEKVALRLKPTILNMPKHKEYKLTPATVELTYLKPKEYQAADDKRFRIVADINKMKSKKINLAVSAPEYAREVKLHPETVTVK